MNKVVGENGLALLGLKMLVREYICMKAFGNTK